MVANNNAPRQGTVADLIASLLDRRYNSTVEPVLNAIARGSSSPLLQRRFAELQAEAARLADAGQRFDPDNPVLRALMADLADQMRANAALLGSVSDALQADAISAAGTIQRQLALPGMTDAQLARLGVVWNRPDPEAVARLVQYAQSDAWAAELAKYGDDVLGVVNNQVIRGIALGWSPLRVAEEITRLTRSLPVAQANNLARTMQLTAYRDATAAHQTANRDIAQSVIRIAALDARTCLACIAQHGMVIWDSDRDSGSPVPRVEDHHSGRCTSVIQVKGRPLAVQTGPEWFAALPEARQRQQASFASSPGKYEAYQSGRATLADFVQPYTDRVFGQMQREASLTSVLRK